jgi:hypothetical protein
MDFTQTFEGFEEYLHVRGSSGLFLYKFFGTVSEFTFKRTE